VGIFSTHGRQSWFIEEFALPVAVTNSGAVIALRATFNPGTTLILCRKGLGRPIELGKDILDATVAGGRIYFMQHQPGDSPKTVLKSMPLPRE